MLVCRFFFFLEKEFLQIARKKSFSRKKKKKTHGKKISLVFANWLILGIGHKLPNLHKLTYWFDVLTNRNAGFYIAPPPFPRIWKFGKIIVFLEKGEIRWKFSTCFIFCGKIKICQVTFSRKKKKLEKPTNKLRPNIQDLDFDFLVYYFFSC